MSDHAHADHHTGPIKTPSQLLWTVFFSFVVPVFVIIGLVYYVTSAHKPSTSPDASLSSLSGVTADASAQAVAARIQKVGTIEIRDANRPLRAGEDVFKGQCITCHGPASVVPGVPKIGDAAAWAPRIKTGLESLVNSALKGKGAMAAQGGGDFNDTEIARAVVYLANSAGGKFAEPQAPAAAGAAPAAAAGTAAAPQAAAKK